MEIFEDGVEEREKEDLEFENCIAKTPGMFKQESYIQVPNHINRNVLYQKWRGTPKASTVWFLIGYILRAKCGNPMAEKIYKDYYVKQHLLVARFTQQSIADMFGYKDRRAINNHLSACKDDGIFRTEDMPWRNRKIRIYIFGSWENKTGCNYVETIDMFINFKKKEADRKLAIGVFDT